MTVKATDCGFNSHSTKRNEIFSFLSSDVEAKHVIEFYHSTDNPSSIRKVEGGLSQH